MKCPQCGAIAEPNFKFCGECGASFIQAKQKPQGEAQPCKRCSKQMDDDVRTQVGAELGHILSDPNNSRILLASGVVPKALQKQMAGVGDKSVKLWPMGREPLKDELSLFDYCLDCWGKVIEEAAEWQELLQKARTRNTYHGELADAHQELSELVRRCLNRLQQRYGYFSKWKLREERQEDYDRMIGEGYIWALHGGDRWVEVVLDADLETYVGGWFTPRLTVRAQVHETPTWGSLLMAEPLDRRQNNLVICPIFNSDKCEKELFDTLSQVVGAAFLGKTPQAESVPAVPSASIPKHNVKLEEIRSNPDYWNTAWIGADYELQKKTKEINAKYFQTHTYIEGETDCNDMAIDIWNMLLTEGISSVIVIGNLDRTAETFAECNHAWLLIFNKDGSAFALEPTNGECYSKEDIEQNPRINQYWQGFFYKQPSDLRADIKERW